MEDKIDCPKASKIKQCIDFRLVIALAIVVSMLSHACAASEEHPLQDLAGLVSYYEFKLGRKNWIVYITKSVLWRDFMFLYTVFWS